MSYQNKSARIKDSVDTTISEIVGHYSELIFLNPSRVEEPQASFADALSHVRIYEHETALNKFLKQESHMLKKRESSIYKFLGLAKYYSYFRILPPSLHKFLSFLSPAVPATGLSAIIPVAHRRNPVMPTVPATGQKAESVTRFLNRFPVFRHFLTLRPMIFHKPTHPYTRLSLFENLLFLHKIQTGTSPISTSQFHSVVSCCVLEDGDFCQKPGELITEMPRKEQEDEGIRWKEQGIFLSRKERGSDTCI